MAFIAPENQQPEEQKPQGFIAPENQAQDVVPAAQDTQPPSLIDNLVSKAGEASKRLLAPLAAVSKPVQSLAKGFIAPENTEGRSGLDALNYERSSEYPHTGITELGPSMDVAFAAQAGKDLVGLAGKGVKKVLENQAEKKALKSFISEPVRAEGISTSPIESLTSPKSAVGPDLGTIQRSTPKELPAITPEQIPTDKPVAVFRGSGFGGDFYDVYNSPLNSESNVRVTLSGEEGLKKIQDAGIEIIGKIPEAGTKQPKGLMATEMVKPPEPKQLEFPTPKPAANRITFDTKQTRAIEKQLGKPIESKIVEPTTIEGTPTTGTSTDITPAATMVPKTEQAKAIERAANDIMREPIQPPSPPKPPSRLLPGGEQRVKAFQEAANVDISPRNPLTSRAELNKKVGTAEDVATKQWLEGVKAENKAVENSILDKKALYDKVKIRPDSLESEALFRYIEHPNKMEAYGRIAQAAGTEKADEIVKAADQMRGTYDRLFSEVNKARITNGEKPIRYRADYITHANEMNVLSDIGKLDLLDTPEGKAIVDGVMGADTKLAQNPNLYGRLKNVIFPFTSRKGEETSLDAINNFNRYVDSAHRYIQTQPYVNELLDTAQALETKAPNISLYLKQQANFIAGGKSILDKGIEAVVDKDLLKIAQQLQNNAKGNVISMNPSVPITQLFGLVPTAGKFPLKASLGAAINSFANPEFEKYMIANVPVLQSRALGAAENDLVLGPVSRQSARITSWFDYKVAEISAMAAYKDAIAKGKSVADALQDANSWAAISQAHLGKVSTPPLMQSKNIQALLPLMNQQIAYGRSLLLHTLQGKTLTEKSLAATKALIFGTAVATIKEAVTGHPDHPLSPTNVLPFGGVLEHGAGGPLLNQTARLVTAKSQEDFVRQLIRSAFLLQNKIPGGAIVGKQVENFFMGKKRKK